MDPEERARIGFDPSPEAPIPVVMELNLRHRDGLVDNDFPQPGTGRVVRVTRHGLVPVATGLSFPTAMTFGPDGHLYVSERGYGGDPTAGRILRVAVS